VAESDEWISIADVAKDKQEKFFKNLSGMTLFSALYGTYTVNVNELKAALKANNVAGQNKSQKVIRKQQIHEEVFQEVRRRKRHSTDETPPKSEERTAQVEMSPAAMRNFFAPSPRQRIWTRILPLPRSFHMKRKPLTKQVGLPQ
jgi:hypothetical protein